MDEKPAKHIIKTAAQFSAYKQWLDDCYERFFSGLDTTQEYSASEIQSLFTIRKSEKLEEVSETPALLSNLSRQRERSEKRESISQLQKDIINIAKEKNIIPKRDEKKFWRKLFRIAPSSKEKLYGQYENMQRNNNILAIFYLDAPYSMYAIFNKEGKELVRYKLYEKNKKTEKQDPSYLIDDHVDLKITNKKFLGEIHRKYNVWTDE